VSERRRIASHVDVSSCLPENSVDMDTINIIDPLFQQIPIGILYLNADGSIRRANPAFCRLTGFTEAELRRMDNRDISYPADLAIEVRLLQWMMAQSLQLHTFEKRYVCWDGNPIWTSVTLSLVGDWEAEEGWMIYFVSNLSDRDPIRQDLRKQEWDAQQRSVRFEQFIRELTSTLHRSLDEAQLFCTVVDGLIPILHADACFFSVCDPQTENLSIRYEAFSPLEGQGKRSWIGQPLPLPRRLQHCQHAGTWQDGSVGNCFDALEWSTAGIRMFCPVVWDRELLGVLMVIREQNHPFEPVEVQLLEQTADCCAIGLRQAHLYRSEYEQRLNAEHFRRFLAISNDVYVEYDRDGRYLFINPSGYRLLGMSPEQILGKTNRELLGDAADSLELILGQVIRTQEKLYIDHELPLSQGTHIFESVYTPILSPDGSIHRVIGICREITDLQHQWRLLEQQNYQLAETTRIKEELVAMTSHELRTPLTAILGFSNVLLQEFFGPLNLKQKEYLDRIHGSGQHLLELINDILDLSRLEANRLELDLQAIWVPDLCEGVMGVIQEYAHAQGLEMRLEIAPEVEWMTVDPKRLKQMLLNLLSNAVKFTPTGGIGLKVYPQTEPLEETAGTPRSPCPSCGRPTMQFVVWDTGIGIAPSDQRQLFSPFSQIDSSLSRQHQGSGLGLAITRKLAELHNGIVTVESTSDQGSRFTISLPLRTPGQEPQFWVSPPQTAPPESE